MLFTSSYDCNGTGAQKWVLQRGSTKVKLAGTNFCLDAGSSKLFFFLSVSSHSRPTSFLDIDTHTAPGNAIGMKIWQCYDNLPAQQWYYTDDDRIALEGKGSLPFRFLFSNDFMYVDLGLCLDLTNGVIVNSNQVQTWQCTDGNNNQIWYW